MINSNYALKFNNIIVDIIKTPLVEPANSPAETEKYFKFEIVRGLTKSGFFALTFPTPQVNCLGTSDIVDEMLLHDDLKALHQELITTKSGETLVKLLKEISTISIDRLADKWAKIEAAAWAANPNKH
jgi:hypothetical protein